MLCVPRTALLCWPLGSLSKEKRYEDISGAFDLLSLVVNNVFIEVPHFGFLI